MQFTKLFTLTFAAFAALVPAAPTEPTDICLAICYLQEPDCTPPSYPKNEGECWTCCTPQA
ncbi:hypothetical protein BJY01DRAFT_243347 [Aspergillus pseudoustus]|uniref:Uncharacterized protein n=1 Tax=Aspergillus pseudoustus TaxID=1810923 RepID=A0ABR4KSW0_9EURO